MKFKFLITNILFVMIFCLCSCVQKEEIREIEKFFINENGHLFCYWSDGSFDDLGVIQGKDGVNGKDGIDGKDGVNGKDGIDGKAGVNGKDGIDGKDGISTIITIPIEIEKKYNLTFANPESFYSEITTVGNTFKYLVVYNCSDNTAGGTYDSYVLGCYDKVEAYGDIYTYCHTGLVYTGNNKLMYLNFSCFNYVEGEDYSKYITDCTNRTSPGRYWYDGCSGFKDWEDADYGMGMYILTNARVYFFHNSRMCSYGGTPVGQVIILYDEALTPVQLLQR